EYVRKYLPRKTCAIISDESVAAIFGSQAIENLTRADYRPTLITIPAGEKSKNLNKAGGVCNRMIAAGLDRESFVIGLGGGVIGDISGFVAANFPRGCRQVQIATTLLSIEGSSMHRKT